MHSASYDSTQMRVEDPQLGFSQGSLLFVRLVTSITLMALVFVSLYLLLQEGALFSLGLFGLLFLVERLVYRQSPRKTLSRVLHEKHPNIAKSLAPASVLLLQRASARAKESRVSFLFALLDTCAGTIETRTILRHTEVELEKLFLERSSPKKSDGSDVQEVLVAIVQSASEHALLAHHESITPGDILFALLSYNDVLFKGYLTEINLKPSTVSLAARMYETQIPVRRLSRTVTHHIMNRAWTSRPTPTLDLVSTDLTDQARIGALPHLIGHEKPFKQLLTTLARPTRPHGLLVGNTGSGRSVVVGALARAIVSGTAPPALLDRRLVEIDIPALFSRAGSNPAKLIKKVGDEILMSGNIILYFPDIEHLTQTQGSASLALVDVLLPILHSDSFPVLASTSPSAYTHTLEQRSDITGSFEAVRLDLLTAPQVEEVLLLHARRLERRTSIPITVSALQRAATLATRYLAPEYPVPGSAIELLETALGKAKGRVTASLVEEVLEERVGTKVSAADKEEAQQLLQLEKTLQEKVIGQDEAISALSEALRAHRTGLIPGEAPPSFLFVGSTGVGKTELATQLAKLLYGADSFVRLDMSEFSQSNSVERLLGSTDGKVTGMLTNPVRKHPRTLLLLDELEKADVSVIKLLLQVLGEGRLTDGAGNLVSYKDAVLIMTSNAGSGLIQESLRRGEHMSEIADYLREKLTTFFAPELLNRFTRLIVFNDLDIRQENSEANFIA